MPALPIRRTGGRETFGEGRHKSMLPDGNTRRVVRLLVFLLSALTVVAAVDLHDLGVPVGYTAGGYEYAGLKLLDKHQYEAARKYFTAAIRIEPDRWSAYGNRAIAFMSERKWRAALEDLNWCIHYQPAFLLASLNRASVYERLGNYNACLKDLDRVVALTKEVGNYDEHAHALNDRAWLQSVCPNASFRNGQRAVTDARKACELTKWKVPAFIDTLAAAYAETGDFDSAIRYELLAAEKIASETTEEAKKDPNGYAARLQLYRSRRPYRGSAD
jgi:predicted Zn-dependent protease